MSSHSNRLCACGCGEFVRSLHPAACYRRGHRARSQFGTPEERFWANVEMGVDCWLWQGRPSFKNGYGEIHVRGKTLSSHRYSWQLHYGTIPKGLSVLHSCDVRMCVNPNHLFLGTMADNMADKLAKGRQAKGESNGNAKLTASQVIRIRGLYAHSTSIREIATAFKVSADLVYRIVKRELWKHILDEE